MSNVDYTLAQRIAWKKLLIRLDKEIAPAEICSFCKRLKRQGYDCPECKPEKEAQR